jgi:hypothetical protein
VRLFSRRRAVHVLIDAALVALAWYLAFALRFDFEIPGRYEELLARRAESSSPPCWLSSSSS